MSESVVPALPELDALRERAEKRLGYPPGFDVVMMRPLEVLALLDHVASLQRERDGYKWANETLKEARRKDLRVHEEVCRERDELRIEVATMRCIHTGSGLPLCRTCDPRTTDEGGSQPVSRNTTTEGEERASHADALRLPNGEERTR